jgi:DNA-binding MarR family transcriptional regulator
MTAQERAVWRSLIDTTEELRGILAAQLLRDSNLSSADYQVLLALAEASGRQLRSSRLAEAMGWERSRLSHQLSRMEGRGLVRRDYCATDGRGAEISLTAEGAEIFRGATAPHMRAVKESFADALTPGQFEALGGILQTLQDHLHPERAAAAGNE